MRSFKQELVGVFGFPVAENPTQAMIEPAFADMGLDWRYLTVEVRWPSGRVDTYRDLATDRGYLLREGETTPSPLAGFSGDR